MSKSLTCKYKTGFIALSLFVLPVPAFAYVGPGAGLTLLGSLLGLIFAILFVLFGIVSWPVRILWRRFFAKKQVEGASVSSSDSEKITVNETEK